MPELRRVLVFAKRTSYDRYIRQQGVPRVKELLARGDVTVARMVRADEHHHRTVEEVQRALEAVGAKVTLRYRDRLEAFDAFDLVVTVGGDGTLLWASHGVGDTPMLGVNSAPHDSVGFLCGTRMGEVLPHIEAIARGTAPRVKLARMQVSVEGVVVHRRVLNDVLFANPHPAHTSRYLLSFRGMLEEQKSSGLWISTGAGSTAAIRSAGGRLLSLRSRLLQFVVREPYTPDGAPYSLPRGLVHPGERLEIFNKMRECRLYVDGPRLSLPVELGQRVTFCTSDEPLTVMGVSTRAVSERQRHTTVDGEEVSDAGDDVRPGGPGSGSGSRRSPLPSR